MFVNFITIRTIYTSLIAYVTNSMLYTKNTIKKVYNMHNIASF